MEHLRLSDGEWKLMKTLWQRQPRTLAELVAALDTDDLHDAQAAYRQRRGHDGRQREISAIQRRDHVFRC